MGIRFYCPNGHKLNVKSFQAGRRGICPFCGAKIIIPTQSTRRSSKAERGAGASAKPGAEQEVLLQADFAGQPTPAARHVDSSHGTAGANPAATAAHVPAETPAQGGSLPTATPIGFHGPTQDPAPGATGEATSPAAANRDLSSPANMQNLPVAAPHTPAAFEPAPASPSPSQAPPSATGRDEPPDPLAEAANVVWYVRPPSGGQFGPATSEVMRTWIGEGRVSADSLVWREGWRDWQAAGEVFPQLGAGNNEFEFDVAGPSGSAAKAVLGKIRSRRRETIRQVSIISLLILAVCVLVGVFAWVVIYYQ